MERLGRRRKQLLNDLENKRGRWKLKEEELYRILWRNRVGRSSGPVVKIIRFDYANCCHKVSANTECDELNKLTNLNPPSKKKNRILIGMNY